MNINTALEGKEVCYKLRKELAGLSFNPDLMKMLKNIEGMVTEISKLEVTCRRTSSKLVLEAPLEQLNNSISHLEKLILIAKLMA